VHTSEQPAKTKGNYGGRVGLRLDRTAYPLLKRSGSILGSASRIRHAISSLAVQVLSRTGGLIYQPFGLGSGIPSGATKTLLHFAGGISDCSCYAVFVHRHHSLLAFEGQLAGMREVPILARGHRQTG
jgi:hypothetical protein